MRQTKNQSKANFALTGGDGGIWTPAPVFYADLPVFKTGPFNHLGTSPNVFPLQRFSEKGETLGEKSRFSLNFLQPRPVENIGKIENRLPKYSPVFKTVPFNRLGTSPNVFPLQRFSEKGEKLGEKSRFSLNFLSPQPVENTGEIEKRLPKCPPVFKTAPLCPLR